MLRRTSCGRFVYRSIPARWVLACVRLGEVGSLYSRIRWIDKLSRGESLGAAKSVSWCLKLGYAGYMDSKLQVQKI